MSGSQRSVSHDRYPIPVSDASLAPSSTSTAPSTTTPSPTPRSSQIFSKSARTTLPTQKYILISIDFGTTFSGVSYALCDPRHPLRDSDIVVIQDWPGKKNEVKIPTKISYDTRGEPVCGYEIPSDSKPIEWFKLLLLDNHRDRLPEHLQHAWENRKLKEARKRLNSSGKDLTRVIADYLGYLWTHAQASIRRAKLDPIVNAATFLVELTYPAIWPFQACDIMKQAAKDAGIQADRGPRVGETLLRVVSEPEAAALASYQDFQQNYFSTNSHFNVGDTFVVLDAGGGTCDVITYVVNSLEPWKVSECVKGDGDLCGAIFLDQSFREKFAEWLPKSKSHLLDESEAAKMWRDQWERGLKKEFDGDEREGTWNFIIPKEWRKSSIRDKLGLNGSKLVKIDGAEMTIPKKEMEAVWAPVQNRIFRLVNSQVLKAKEATGKTPSIILLAGGLGGNMYLYKILKDAFERQQGIYVLQQNPPLPWSAISRGGVHRARQELNQILPASLDESELTEGVISRKARQSYGITEYVDFIDGIHNETDRHDMKSVGRVVAVNQMSWYLKIDENMAEKEPFRAHWRRYLPFSEPRSSIHVEILVSSSDPPPKRKSDSVHLLCKIEVKLPEWSDLPPHENETGDKFKKVEFELLMTPTGNALDWTAFIRGVNSGHMKTPILQLTF